MTVSDLVGCLIVCYVIWLACGIDFPLLGFIAVSGLNIFAHFLIASEHLPHPSCVVLTIVLMTAALLDLGYCVVYYLSRYIDTTSKRKQCCYNKC